jgi:hypothetical protein
MNLKARDLDSHSSPLSTSPEARQSDLRRTRRDLIAEETLATEKRLSSQSSDNSTPETLGTWRARAAESSYGRSGGRSNY